MHAYMHTYIHTYIHAYIPTHTHIYQLANILGNAHTCHAWGRKPSARALFLSSRQVSINIFQPLTTSALASPGIGDAGTPSAGGRAGERERKRERERLLSCLVSL